jgi:hypothetical protein
MTSWQFSFLDAGGLASCFLALVYATLFLYDFLAQRKHQRSASNTVGIFMMATFDVAVLAGFVYFVIEHAHQGVYFVAAHFTMGAFFAALGLGLVYVINEPTNKDPQRNGTQQP